MSSYMSHVGPDSSPIMGQFMSIDPGVECGFAFWKDSCLTQFGVINYQTYAGIAADPLAFAHSNQQLDCWLSRVMQTTMKLGYAIHAYGPDIEGIVCEWPKHFDSEGGRASEVSGDFGKLMFAVGIECSLVLYRNPPLRLSLVDVNDWKGQMPKAAVEARIRKRFAGNLPQGIHSHAWDAIGIGLSYLGVL